MSQGTYDAINHCWPVPGAVGGAARGSSLPTSPQNNIWAPSMYQEHRTCAQCHSGHFHTPYFIQSSPSPWGVGGIFSIWKKSKKDGTPRHQVTCLRTGGGKWHSWACQPTSPGQMQGGWLDQEAVCVCACLQCHHMGRPGAGSIPEGTSAFLVKVSEHEAPVLSQGEGSPLSGWRAHGLYRQTPNLSKKAFPKSAKGFPLFHGSRWNWQLSAEEEEPWAGRWLGFLESVPLTEAPGCLNSSSGCKQIGPRKLGQHAAKRHFLLVRAPHARARALGLPSLPHFSALSALRPSSVPLLSSLLLALPSFWSSAPVSPVSSLAIGHPPLRPLSSSHTSGISTQWDNQSVVFLNRQCACFKEIRGAEQKSSHMKKRQNPTTQN